VEIKLYNFLTRKKEIFKPIKDKKVGIYTCGPTVYDKAHIGNLRTYIFEDILKRALVYSGYKVKHVMNITDVDDKIIKKMREERKTLGEITRPFTKIFFEDLKKLNIQKANVYPKATETIKEITGLISTLLEKKYAYKGSDGSIYFDVSKFKGYGKLSQTKVKPLCHKGLTFVGISADEYGKKEAADFALWKAARANEPAWPAPFGAGRPGWHIECSAMSMKYLGKNFDIHSGAVDLIFPHHENEIAQSEAATGKKFVNFWLEAEHLLVDGKKMSKSLGNFYTLNDIEKRGFNPLAFRYLVLTSHYRSQLNFTWQSLEAARAALEKLRAAVADIKKETQKIKSNPPLSRRLEEKFLKSVNDDLNLPKALAVLWEAVRNPGLSGKEKRALIGKFDEVFGLGLKNIKKVSVPQEIMKLVAQRERFRKGKKWQEADAIRQRLEKNGWMVKDTNTGPEISKSKT
jgi:cysteinyl-tRNA synthetase